MSRKRFIDDGQIQTNGPRIMLPEELIYLGIAETESSLFWADDTSTDTIAISRFKRGFGEDDRFKRLEDSRVMENRVTLIPDAVRTAASEFDPGTRLEFMTTPPLLSEHICWVGPDLKPSSA